MYLSMLLLAAGWVFSPVTATPVLTVKSHALTSILSKLTEYYHASPNVTSGLFDQSISPWWESGSIFEASFPELKPTSKG